MKDLQNLVYKYMESEEITLKQAMLQASLGMCSKAGDVAEICRGVCYSGYPYSEERKKRNAEHLGEILFYWVMMASTCDVSPEEIMNQYISAYIARTKLLKEEDLRLMQASIKDMLKYVKIGEQWTQKSVATAVDLGAVKEFVK
jgi:hypothetical protein